MTLNEAAAARAWELKQRHDSQCPQWALVIGETLLRASAHHTANLNARHKKLNIKFTPLSLLYATVDKGGRISQKTLAERFPYSAQAMTLALNSLERDGYIEREQDTKDKRANYIVLTDRGLDCVEEALSLRETYYAQITRLLTEEEATSLVATLNKLDRFYQSSMND